MSWFRRRRMRLPITLDTPSWAVLYLYLVNARQCLPTSPLADAVIDDIVAVLRADLVRRAGVSPQMLDEAIRRVAAEPRHAD